MQTAEATSQESAQRQQAGGEGVVESVEGNADKVDVQYSNFQIQRVFNLDSAISQASHQPAQRISITVPVLQDTETLHQQSNKDEALTNLRVAVITGGELRRTVEVTTAEEQQCSSVSDGTPMEEDDQHNEEKFIAQVIVHWIHLHKMNAEQLTEKQKFDNEEMKSFALDVARALDKQCSEHGVSSVNGDDKWNAHAVQLMALFSLGDATWDMGMPLWGPGGKGMVKDFIANAIQIARKKGYLEHDGKVLEIAQSSHADVPEHRKHQTPAKAKSPNRHHRNHQYKLHGRTQMRTIKVPTDEASLPVDDSNGAPTDKLAEPEVPHHVEACSVKEDSNHQPPKLRIPSGKLSLRNSKKRRQQALKQDESAKRAKKLGAQLSNSSAEVGTEDNPIVLDDYDLEEFPINNIQALDLKTNRARAMWRVQSRVRQRGKRDNQKIQWNGDPAELPEDLAIMVKADINGTATEATFDTAAQVTCISKEFWEKVGSPTITQVKGNVCGADGSKLKLLGAVRIKVTLNSEDFFYRAWVIDGLQSKILIGLDFIAWYKVDLLLSSMEAVCGDLRVPLWLEGWGRKKSRIMNSKIKVVATETLTIPAEHERFLPAIASSQIPKQWADKLMVFEPSHVWRGCEIGRFASNSNVSEFPVLTKNMGKQEVRIEAGTILGHLEVMSKGCRIKHLVQNKGGDWVVSEDTECSDPDINAHGEADGQNETMTSGGEQIMNQGKEVVPGDTIAPKDPRQGPATNMVTQDRGRRTSDEGVATVRIDIVVGTGRSPDVAWHGRSEQPEVRSGNGELGTIGKKNENEKKALGAEDDMKALGAVFERKALGAMEGIGEEGVLEKAPVRETDMEVCEGMLECEGGTADKRQQSVTSTPRLQTTVDDLMAAVSAVVFSTKNSDMETDEREQTRSTTQPTTQDDQHSWDEVTFRERMELMLTKANTTLNPKQRDQLMAILIKHKDLWIKNKLGNLDFDYDIEVASYQNPIKSADRRWSVEENNLIRKEIETLLDKKFIEPARTPWASRLVLVPKPDGTTRVCVDYRQLNKVTITDAYPTPRVEHVLERLNGNKFFSTFDCEKGYYQVGLTDRTKDITAFTSPMGLFKWTKMPFGLKNAPAVFQRLMDLVLAGLSWQCCMVFFDDIVVFSKSWEDHIRDLDLVFSNLRSAGMTLNFKKSVFAQTELVYLGYLVSADGMKPNPRKVSAVQDFKAPTNVADLRTFLGMTSYFRKFILNYARVAKPLNELVRKGTGKRRDQTQIIQSWGEEEQNAFDKLKRALTSETTLHFPDLRKPFVLECDASDVAIGAVLLQRDDNNNLRPVEYASRLLSPRETRYSVTEREGLGAVWGVKQFRHYLHGQKFKLVTDHSAIRYMMTQLDPKGRMARWVVTLQEFDFEVEHKPGKDNKAADPLSRLDSTHGRDNTAQPDFDEEIPVPGTDDDLGPGETFCDPNDQCTIEKDSNQDDKWKKSAIVVETALENGVIVRKVMIDRRRKQHRPSTLTTCPDEMAEALITSPAEIPNKTWITAQMADPTWRVMREWIQHKRLSKEHSDLNKWATMADKDYELQDHILCRRVKLDLAGQNIFRLVPVVPKLLQMKVALRAHSRDCCHMGVNKTFDWVRRRFWWPGYFRDVRQVVQECTTCQAIADPKTQTLIEGRIQPKSEFDVVAMDLLKLPTSEDGYKYLLVAVDHFTRFAWTMPLRSKSASATLEAFLKLEMPLNKPRVLLSDNGKEFCNESFDKYCKAFGIEQKFTIPYHPQSDGVVERMNRTLISMLSAYADESGKNWPLLLKKVVSAYNSMKHPVIGMAPYTAMFKLDKEADLFTVSGAREVCDHNEFTQLREWLTEFYTATNEWNDHINNDKRKERVTFREGDLVWCRDYTVGKTSKRTASQATPHKDEGPGKLARKWSGPWLVVATWGNVVMTLKRVGGGQIRRAHLDQVQKFDVTPTTPNELRRNKEPKKPTLAEQKRVLKLLTTESGKAQSGDSDKSSDDEETEDELDETQYAIENVLGHLHTPRGFWFLIKFQGYDEPTWEHESLMNAPEAVTRYFKEVCEDHD